MTLTQLISELRYNNRLSLSLFLSSLTSTLGHHSLALHPPHIKLISNYRNSSALKAWSCEIPDQRPLPTPTPERRPEPGPSYEELPSHVRSDHSRGPHDDNVSDTIYLGL